MIDHVAAALDRLPEQFRDDPNVVALLTAIITPFQALETAQQALLLERGVDVAVGAQLDVIGRLVGQLRDGLDDSTFRRYIRARISTNRSAGITEDLILISVLVLNDAGARIVVDSDQGGAHVLVTIEDVAVEFTVADALITFLRAAKAAGVRLILECIPSLTESFAFEDGEGRGFFGDPATFDLSGLSGSGYTTVIESVDDGETGDLLTLEFVAGGSPPPPNEGTLDESGYPHIVFRFNDTHTTIADFEDALATSQYLRLNTASLVTSGALTAPDDEFAATPFSAAVEPYGGQLGTALE